MNPIPPKALLIGAYPPPIGGNSVHIQRLCDRLRERGCEARVLDYLGGPKPGGPEHVTALPRSLIRRLAGIRRESRRTTPDTIVHFHISALGRFKWIAPWLFHLFRRQRKVLTIHSGSFIARAERLPAAYLQWLCAPFDAIITVSDTQRDFLTDQGLPESRLFSIPAYLPARPDPALVPAAVADGKPEAVTVVTSGDLTPIYQYPPLLDCLERPELEGHRFVFALYGKSLPEYARAILARLDLAPNVIVLRDQSPEVFVSLLGAADAYVRPTTTDGDSVAVREALALGRTVLASDAVPRPAGCITFPLDQPDVLRRLLTGLRRAPAPTAGGLEDPNFVRILGAYRHTGASDLPRLAAALPSRNPAPPLCSKRPPGREADLTPASAPTAH